MVYCGKNQTLLNNYDASEALTSEEISIYYGKVVQPHRVEGKNFPNSNLKTMKDRQPSTAAACRSGPRARFTGSPLAGPGQCLLRVGRSSSGFHLARSKSIFVCKYEA